MSGALVELRSLQTIGWGSARTREPVTLGIPLPTGRVTSTDLLELVDGDDALQSLQAQPLDRWPDGSIRWALLDFAVDTVNGVARERRLRLGSSAAAPSAKGVRVTKRADGVDVATGRAVFAFSIGGGFPFSAVTVDGVEPIDCRRSGLSVDVLDRTLTFSITQVSIEAAGPVRVEVMLTAAARDASGTPIDVWARVEMFAASATARVTLTIRNPRRAQHPGGQWVLGDAGSIPVKSAGLTIESAHPIEAIEYAAEAGAPLVAGALPFELYQESSGGTSWDAPVHRNRDGHVPLRFKGYRLRSDGDERFGTRASPVLVARTASGSIAAAVPQFWENFPRSVTIDRSKIRIGLFAGQAPEPVELQGGEQKTHIVVLGFARDEVSDPPLAWCHDPTLVYPSAEWCCLTGAVPFLAPAGGDDPAYAALVQSALDPVDGFEAKAERADEFGWRNFGDLVADHESAFQPPDRSFVSHYNNQYDAILGFGIQFLRSGDPRWWRLMTNLARHVRDIDIYHTDEDKAAYNGGMFWHTLHYADAGTSTHRSYPAVGKEGGGPSAEHNYPEGLMLHYFLTGDRASRDAVVGLGQWVIDMDDGRLTVFRWLSSSATGLASATDSPTYHGPGRGPAYSINACLAAHRLTGSDRFIQMAERLIRRCIHPNDDIEARELPDAERRWFYTAFLQTLGAYLYSKAECGEVDAMFAYAQASLLHYARWAVRYERPYLERPEVLEFPTETWAAQDMRKAEVFWWAALHVDGPERAAFLERARFFFDHSARELSSLPGRHFTRPLVLMLGNGYRAAWFARHASELPRPLSAGLKHPAAAPPSFEPQKIAAIRRFKWMAVLTAIGMLVLAGLALAR